VSDRCWSIASADDMIELGQRIGANAMAGDVLSLIGNLGAGKTTLTQGIGAGLAIPGDPVRSPTFTLLAEHTGRIPLYHMDVYRLAGAADLVHLGFDDYLTAADGLIVLEWADRVSDALPQDRLELTMTIPECTPSTRLIHAQALGPLSERLLASL
jgi:tRNA threonylcarbamoyladenosine biosynthesis protein TsaE